MTDAPDIRLQSVLGEHIPFYFLVFQDVSILALVPLLEISCSVQELCVLLVFLNILVEILCLSRISIPVVSQTIILYFLTS